MIPEPTVLELEQFEWDLEHEDEYQSPFVGTLRVAAHYKRKAEALEARIAGSPECWATFKAGELEIGVTLGAWETGWRRQGEKKTRLG